MIECPAAESTEPVGRWLRTPSGERVAYMPRAAAFAAVARVFRRDCDDVTLLPVRNAELFWNAVYHLGGASRMIRHGGSLTLCVRDIAPCYDEQQQQPDDDEAEKLAEEQALGRRNVMAARKRRRDTAVQHCDRLKRQLSAM